MTKEDAEPADEPRPAGNSIEICRFEDWRDIRRFAQAEAAQASADRKVCLVAPSEGAVWVIENLLRSALDPGDGGAVVLPEVVTASRALADLAGDLPEGRAAASRLARETVLEEALAAEVEASDAPPGEAGPLTGPLLAFLDEQAADGAVAPRNADERADDRPDDGPDDRADDRTDGTAFEAFCERVGAEFGEATETDEGAARLAALTGWLRRVHRRYRDGLGDLLDPDGLRRTLLRAALTDRFRQQRWTRVAAFGGGALSPADCEVFAALGAPEGIAWALPADASLPPAPAGVEFREVPPPRRGGAGAAGPAAAGTAAEGRQESGPVAAEQDENPEIAKPGSRPGAPPSLFRAPPEAAAPNPLPRKAGPVSVFTPPPSADGGAGGIRPFVETDRDDEARLAARLLAAFRDETPGDFRGFDRCAVVMQQPASYLGAVETAFSQAGIPFRTPERPLLAAEPGAAGLGALLDFAEKPEFLPRGLTLLRDPFLRAEGLSRPPARAADLAERALARGNVRATLSGNDEPGNGGPAAGMRSLAGRFRKDVARFEQRAEASANGVSARKRQEAREDAAAAEVLEVFSRWSEDLAAFRSPEAGLESAAAALLDFDRAHFRRGRPAFGPGGPEESAAVSDAVSDAVSGALEQARAAAAGIRAGGNPGGVAGRLRRLFLRRGAPRRTPEAGVHLLSAADAVFGDYDFVVLLGLGDADWPGPRPTNIFFPPSALEAATRARRADRLRAEVRLLKTLAGLPAQAFAFSRPAQEDGFPAGRSALEVELTEELERIGARPLPPPPSAAADAGPAPVGRGPRPADPAPPLPRFLDRRAPSARVLERPLSPTALDRYAESPAEFFARNVLYLDEEPELSDIAPPTERGLLLHEVLERGVPRLPPPGGRRASGEDFDRALDLLEECLSEAARKMGLDETALRNEAMWLFGNEAEPGALEWFLLEDWGRGPAEPRDFELRLKGEVEPGTASAPPLVVSGRADRVDTLADGRLRVLEYKSGRLYRKPLQARLYARILEAGGRVAPDYAIAYFGDRRWAGPDESPAAPEQDETIRAVRDGLARAEFGLPGKEPPFGMPLVSRHDLPDARDASDAPDAPDAPEAPQAPPGAATGAPTGAQAGSAPEGRR